MVGARRPSLCRLPAAGGSSAGAATPCTQRCWTPECELIPSMHFLQQLARPEPRANEIVELSCRVAQRAPKKLPVRPKRRAAAVAEPPTRAQAGRISWRNNGCELERDHHAIRRAIIILIERHGSATGAQRRERAQAPKPGARPRFTRMAVVGVPEKVSDLPLWSDFRPS